MPRATDRMTDAQHRFMANRVIPRRWIPHDDHTKTPATPSPCTAHAGELTAWIYGKIRSRQAHWIRLKHKRAYTSETRRGRIAPPSEVEEAGPSSKCSVAPGALRDGAKSLARPLMQDGARHMKECSGC